MFAFDSSVKEPQGFDQPAWWYIFDDTRLIVQPAVEGGLMEPFQAADIRHNQGALGVKRIHFLGALDGVPCYVGEAAEGVDLPEGWQKAGLRRLFGQIDDEHARVAGRAIQILNWDRNHQFCGRCATPTDLTSDDRSRLCPNCGLRAYPRLSPAVIMAILRDDQLLLGRSSRHPQGFYSVLAGFAEPGETLEEAVAREIFEEVGLKVRNIRYFGSQPWPFPDSLMIGFTCEYEGGEISLEDSEIHEADWYRVDQIPALRPPAAISIAGQLIDWFISQHAA